MDPYMDLIWILDGSFIWILYGSYMDPYMDLIWISYDDLAISFLQIMLALSHEMVIWQVVAFNLERSGWAN